MVCRRSLSEFIGEIHKTFNISGFQPSNLMAVVQPMATPRVNRCKCHWRLEKVGTFRKRKNKKASDEKQRQYLRTILSKERATRLEGNFGTEKEHYNLRKIKARTSKTEILWIFFGIHTANAVRIIEKMKRGALQSAT
jgi:hypothetical protein